MKILFILLLSTIFSAYSYDIAEKLDGPDLPFGSWKPLEMCKNGSYAIGFRIKMNTPDMNVFDNEALGGIELVCSNSTSVTNTPRSGEIHNNFFRKSVWKDFHYCKKGEYLTGFNLKQQDRQGFFHDDLGGVNIEFECSDKSVLVDNVPYHQGYWRKWQRCENGGAICGIKTKIDRSIFDSAGLVTARFICCSKPPVKLMPSISTLPLHNDTNTTATPGTTVASNIGMENREAISSTKERTESPTTSPTLTTQNVELSTSSPEATTKNSTIIKIPLSQSHSFDFINSLLQKHLNSLSKLNITINELEHKLNESKKNTTPEEPPYFKTIIRRNEDHPNGTHITFRRVIISKTPTYTLIKNNNGAQTNPYSPVQNNLPPNDQTNSVPHHYVPLHKTVPIIKIHNTSPGYNYSPISIYAINDGRIVKLEVNTTVPNASNTDSPGISSQDELSKYYYGMSTFFHVLAIVCACIFFFVFGYLCKKIYVLKFSKDKNNEVKDVSGPPKYEKDVEKGQTVHIPEKSPEKQSKF